MQYRRAATGTRGLLLAPALFLTLSAAAEAGLRADPVRVYLTPDQRHAAVEVSNDSDRDLTFHVQSLRWTQLDGSRNDYAEVDESRDGLTYFPQVKTLAAGESAIVRVGYAAAWPRSAELSYRLNIGELPNEVAGQSGLRMLIKLSLPLFVEPLEDTEPKVVVGPIALRQGRLVVPVRNHGPTRLSVGLVNAEVFDRSGQSLAVNRIAGQYVLPRSEWRFTSPLSDDVRRDAHRVLIALLTHELGDRLQCEWEVGEPSDCVRRPAGATSSSR